jgi:sarcosine oxidase subunit alpha
MYADFRDRNDVFTGLVARFPASATMTMRNQAERVDVELVSGNTFEVLGVNAVVGRTLTQNDDRTPGAHPVAVISHSFWQRRFAATPAILNQVVVVNSTPVTIVGVAPAGFAGVAAARTTDLFMPLMMKAQVTPTWDDLDSRTIGCDAIAVGGGMSPTLHLYSQAGGRLRYDEGLACFLPRECSQEVQVVGAANGEFATPQTYNIGLRKLAPAKTGGQWVDFLHDVTASDIELACRENLRSVEHVKRYTTTGMAIDQGKTSNLNALTLLGELTGRSPAEVGTTTFRPMFTPVTMGAIAGVRRGDFYAPAKRLPAHDWHAAKGAEFEDYGGWDRPAYYGEDREASIRRETLLVRKSVGVFDASPLGKIEVKGPDAAIFLDRMYVNTVPTLKQGKVRYGLMLDENGVIIDDGVFIRLAENHFLINTTSGHADRIAAWLEEWHQCEWSGLDLVMSPVTSQWAVVTVAGPLAREVLRALPGMIDLSTERFSHMSFASGVLDDDTPYRIQRVSFTGEQSYELSVPADRATESFERIWQAGEPHGIGLFGAESLMILRLEKGFLHVGVDTDVTSNPFDAGFGRIVENKQGDFIGARSLRRAEDGRSDRRQLIGFETDDKQATVVAGAHIVTGHGTARRSEGFVTSACLSPTLGKTIGLGLLERGFERKGEEIEMYDRGQVATARVVDPCFYDSQGVRMRG